ncbi:response regulator [Amycolatopsis pithecellobii]|uniref:Response regulator n=1 Tax=Amycolatopsis pithecellobii TaxID=664692 RepID=A0A6N7Z341_9PSEU|nr:response regulator transcription factor [Amycolatopsis pithecellobii]MTD56243.1 response regulator [Amycolatopsis pithecellobii]
MTPIRLLIVDDHPVVRDGLCGLFSRDDEFEVVGSVGTGADAVRLAEHHEVDVVLMDLRMPRMSGVDATLRLREIGHPARVLILTTYDTDREVLPAIDAGATGYLLKDAPRDELVGAVRAAHAEKAVPAPPVTDTMSRPAGDGMLNARELEVLRLVAEGASTKAVARRLLVSETTIRTQLRHIYPKLGVGDRAEAVAVAYRRGLIPR